MSHTSTISNIKIVDLRAFERAIKALQSQGVGITVVHNEVPKAYYNDQEGMTEPALQVLKIDGSDYDVALYATGKGQHELRFDPFMGSVERSLGASREAISKIDKSTTEGREEVEQARLGKLYQQYALYATLNTTARSGNSVQQQVLADGSIQLTIAIAA